MTSSQFAMVEELASLVKKNDDSKSLILSVEDLLVDYLEGRSSLDGAIELVPMAPFNGMLVHRLAEIFWVHQAHSFGAKLRDVNGVCHVSSQESVLSCLMKQQRKIIGLHPPDTLLSHYLWKTRQWEVKQSPTIYDVLMQKEVSPGQKADGQALGIADKGEKRELTSRDTQEQFMSWFLLSKTSILSKSLILSVEEMLVNYLEDDTSSDGLLELVPMGSFDRMLVHRLADIFGFSSHSVGEEKDRHVVLERCSESSIPDLLVSRLLWKTRKWETLQPPTTCDVLLQKEVLPDKDEVKINTMNDATHTNSSKKMKLTQSTTMPEDNKAGEEAPTVDGCSQEAQLEDHSDGLTELKNDTPNSFLKL